MSSSKKSLALLIAAVAACAPAREPKAVAPQPVLAAGPQARAGADAAPLVLDWTSAQRDALVDATHDALAVVRYDGASLALVAGCRARGDYGAMKLDPQARTATLHAPDEVWATLPTTGRALAAALAHEDPKSPLATIASTVALVRRTTRGRVSRADLEGTCDGATHVVLGVEVGAAHVASRAFTGDVGDARKCATPSDDLEAAPAGCDAPIALELRAIADAPRPPVALAMLPGPAALDEDEVRPFSPACPDALAMTHAGACAHDAGACDAADPRCEAEGPKDDLAKKLAWLARRCRAGDAASCAEAGARAEEAGDAKAAVDFDQRACGGGSAAACARLARLAAIGEGGLLADRVESARLLARACDGGDAAGCAGLAHARGRGVGLPQMPDAAYDAATAACGGGSLVGCASLARLLARGTPSHRADAAVARGIASRGCEAAKRGDGAEACLALGSMAENDQASARAFARACDLGAVRGCVASGDRLATGRGVDADVAAAMQLWTRACEAGEGAACRRAGERLVDGDGVAEDAATGALFLEKGCAAADARACASLGALVAKGAGSLPKDAAKAQKLLEAGCHGGARSHDDDACVDLAALVEKQDPRRAAALERRACDRGVARGCERLARRYRADVKKTATATTLLARACSGGDALACDAPAGKTLAQLDAACFGGKDARACARLGAMLRYGDGAPRAPARAARAFAIACAEGAGDAPSCGALADMTAIGRGVAEDAARATDLGERACAHGAGGACAAAALRATGKQAADLAAAACAKGVLADCAPTMALCLQGEPRACVGTAAATSGEDMRRTLYKRACDLDDARGCVELGKALLPDRDPERAASAFQLACDAFDDDGCRALADAYDRGSGIVHDPARANAIDRDLCDRGMAEACAALGARLGAPGEGRDPTAAAGALARACDAHDAHACVALAKEIAEGDGVPRDGQRALATLRVACAEPNAEACTTLGLAYAIGKGAPKSAPRAAAFFLQACTLDPRSGCDELADLYATGAGVPEDDLRAAVLYRRSCDAADPESCLSLGFMFFAGLGIDRDEERAVALFRQNAQAGADDLEASCNDGFARDCTVVGAMFEALEDHTAAAKWLRKGCSLGDPAACSRAPR